MPGAAVMLYAFTAQHPMPNSQPRRLRLAGEPPPASEAPGLALAAKGFRPFFLLAGAFAVALVPLWVAALFGLVDPGAYLGSMFWHAHEMVFGFAVAVIAGFLLTAVGNWTQRETLVGAPLLALAALWLAGRVALSGALPLPHPVVAAIDLAFLPALAVAIGRPLVAARSDRNLVMLAVVAALWFANLTVHLDALGLALPGWRRRGSLVGVDVVLFVIVVMAGRVFPMFTRNGTGVATVRSAPGLERAAIASLAALTALTAAMPDARITAALSAVAAALVVAQARHWGAQHTRKLPLLWILHAGYAWIPVGLLLRAASSLTPRVPAPVATHALTVGAIGAITLGMMSRVALGHTGRPLAASRAATASFVVVSFAAVVRVGAPLLYAPWYRGSLVLSGALWSLAFALFVGAYARLLASPRVDGKAG